MAPRRGFFELLFDLSFDDFITVRIVRFLFVLSIIVAAIVALMSIFGGMGVTGPFGFRASGFWRVIWAVFFFFVYVIGARVWLEIVVAIFRIAENTAVMARQSRTREPGQH